MSAGKVELVERYKKESCLGKGTYGEVWQCIDTSLDRPVAVKYLHGGAKEYEKLKTEGKALSTLTHKNIVVVHDLGADAKDCWLVMELVDGPNLGEFLRGLVRKGTWLPFEQAKDIIEQILEALEFAHDKGRVHGDIKPANIFLPKTGEAKLGDFGVAKILGVDPETTHGYEKDHERMLGSPTYSAPEVLKGERRDFQSDLFSVGMLAYMLLSGQHPFQDKSGLLMIPDLIRDDTYSPVNLGEIRPEVPEKYVKIVMRLLERDRNKRYRKARDVLDEWREKIEIAQCPVCSAENSVLNKFCGQCGNDLRVAVKTENEAAKNMSASFSLFTAGRSQDAITLIKNSLKKTKKFAGGWSQLAYMLNRERQYEEAEDACTVSIELDKTLSQPYWTRGFARSNLGKFDLAIEDFTEALNKEPDERRKSQILYQRAYAWRLAGNFEKALEDATLAIKTDSSNAKANALREKLQPLLKKT